MQALLVYAHPNPLSFNAAIAAVVKEELQKKGVEVKVKDLYAMNFNPVLSREDFEGFHTGNIPADIKREQEDVKNADIVILVAPIWWYSVPAIMRGYMDRVFSVGFAYEYTESGPRGLLTGKKGLVITTAGADENAAKATGLDKVIDWGIAQALFGFCGFAEYKSKIFYAVTTVSDEERKNMLNEVRRLIQEFV
ncbi:NAD(P)H dehydrogenase (quinone) [Thermosyntropha lipolytica DSM 11003]|uniref:NAD(P)H dehydrogenase (Quinone) n=1 Tax=Thermosyntropha lipolytica DSM 11003 TaxID=1123382 RepID=A0A1M5N3N6_9FIRM|nr:NAD(P)H-dependent oxidoreductase [Thermosyntropha lipolytica]SHG84170.1 NAD(P)H dehydrogenase (quinone) [Thermosyntropha lipolytica DSM 11003]